MHARTSADISEVRQWPSRRGKLASVRLIVSHLAPDGHSRPKTLRGGVRGAAEAWGVAWLGLEFVEGTRRAAAIVGLTACLAHTRLTIGGHHQPIGAHDHHGPRSARCESITQQKREDMRTRLLRFNHHIICSTPHVGEHQGPTHTSTCLPCQGGAEAPVFSCSGQLMLYRQG
eukprot:4855272-Prymnesium_polylepis.1